MPQFESLAFVQLGTSDSQYVSGNRGTVPPDGNLVRMVYSIRPKAARPVGVNVALLVPAATTYPPLPSLTPELTDQSTGSVLRSSDSNEHREAIAENERLKMKLGQDLIVYPDDRKLDASGVVGAILVSTFPCPKPH